MAVADVTEVPIKLTDREIAIASGADPDDTPPAAEHDETPDVSEQPGKDASQEGAAAEAGTDAVSIDDAAGGGKDAASEHGSWITDEIQELGASLDLKPEDVAQFQSAEEFHRAVALAARSKPSQPPPADKPKEGSEAAAKPGDLPDIDVQKYIDGGYDAETVELAKAAKALRDRAVEHEKLLTGFQTQAQEYAVRQQQAYEAQGFHEAADTLGGRFGKAFDDKGQVALSAEQNKAREKLWDAYATIKTGIIQRAVAAGKEPKLPSQKVLIENAKAMAFGADLQQEARQKVTQQLAEQSRKRRPVGATRPVGGAPAKPKPVENVNDVATELAQNPEIVKVWNDIHDGN